MQMGTDAQFGRIVRAEFPKLVVCVHHKGLKFLIIMIKVYLENVVSGSIHWGFKYFLYFKTMICIKSDDFPRRHCFR